MAAWMVVRSLFPTLLYGQGHAYANPWTGSGTEASVGKISRDDLVKFHRTWFKANNATLIVVGATTMAEIRPKLERAFAGWTQGNVPEKNIGTVEQQPRSTVYLLPCSAPIAVSCCSSIGRRRFSRSFWSATSHRRRPIPTSPQSRP